MPHDLTVLIHRARGHGHAPSASHGPPKLRIVVRIDRADVPRLDAARKHFRASRAAVIRAFVAMGLEAAEEQVKAPMPAGEAAP
jgi:hypothetical protein